MNLRQTLLLFFSATFLQAGSYGLVFLLPPLFEKFGGVEKDVGTVLGFTAISTLLTIVFLGHITAIFGLSYFIGLFGFPFIAGWIISGSGTAALLIVAATLALAELLLAIHRYFLDALGGPRAEKK